MLRLLIIITLVGYLLYKLGILKFNFYSEVKGRNPNPNFNRQRPNDVNIDSAPPKQKQKKDFKGGEYVDYEEIK